MRYTQPQSGPIQVDQNHPFGRRKWAAVHVHGQAPFGSASPVATFSGTARNDVGPIGRNLNIVAAGDYLSYGANPGLQLSTQSGILIVDLPSVSIATCLYVTSLASPMGGFALTLQSNNKIEIQRHNVATLMQTSNVAVVGLNVIAWSYNSTTGRARVSLNGIVTSGSSVQTLAHNTVALGRFDLPDGNAASSPHKQYLFAVSPDECLDDIALAQVTKSVQSAWQLFKSPQRVMLAAAAGSPTGTFATTMDDATLAASSAVVDVSTFAATMDSATMAASGAVTDAGTFSSLLAGAIMSATGGIVSTGPFASTLAGASMAASGSSGSFVPYTKPIITRRHLRSRSRSNFGA